MPFCRKKLPAIGSLKKFTDKHCRILNTLENTQNFQNNLHCNTVMLTLHNYAFWCSRKSVVKFPQQMCAGMGVLFQVDLSWFKWIYLPGNKSFYVTCSFIHLICIGCWHDMSRSFKGKGRLIVAFVLPSCQGLHSDLCYLIQ